jgi:hypothetical protein
MEERGPSKVTKYHFIIKILFFLFFFLMVFFQGCLNPVKVIIPQGSLLCPSEQAAVVGGNVLTSQRVVDVILKAFEACAASQGCMNNITFGDETFGYYETVAGGAGAVRFFSLSPNYKSLPSWVGVYCKALQDSVIRFSHKLDPISQLPFVGI